MAEPATLYLPFPFPGSKMLEAIVPEGVSVATEGDTHVLRWSDGSIRIHPMPMEELGPHLQGMIGYLRQHDAAPGAIVRAMHSQGVLGMMVEPAVQHASAWPLLLRLHGMTDSLLFLGGNFYTRDGATLLGDGLSAPVAERVARRAFVLLALAVRGLLDEDAGKPAEAEANTMCARNWAWLVEHGVSEEAEPEEATLLQTPVGKAAPQAIVNAVWRAEGAQVLLWALGIRDLPAHDEQEHPYSVASDVGLGADGASSVLADPSLRSAEEIEALRLCAQGLSWRFVEQRVNPGPVDLAEFATRAPFGVFSLDGVSLIEGDLAVRGAAVSLAPADDVRRCGSIARERHAAANWLVGVNPVYSHVDTPT